MCSLPIWELCTDKKQIGIGRLSETEEKMNLIAHLTDDRGARKEQSLKEHCVQTAEYAKGSIGSADFQNTVYFAGLLHDMGKAKGEFVRYLEAAYRGEKVIKGSVNHSFAAVIWLLEHFHGNGSGIWERMACEIIGFAVGSHHGMLDCVDLDGENGFLHRQQKDKQELCYEETICNYVSEVATEDALLRHFQESVQEIRRFYDKAVTIYGRNRPSEVFFQISMLARLVLSSVIYGDRRDTGEFMDQQCSQETSKFSWKERRHYFEEKLKQLPQVSVLDQVRGEISDQCLEFAERQPGIYRLNVPTGGGKTLASLRFALAHADRHHKKRVIFIIPLLSVLDQNVKVIRDYLPDENEILEHHSNVVREKTEHDELDSFEFVAESWNYPIVVSTLVQFLNILFSHRTTAVERMAALCDSIIVIDEIQTLPTKLIAMFNRAMNFLHEFCNATIILSSATQPCFEELKWPLRLSAEPDMVRLDEPQRRVFKRAEIIDKTNAYGMDWQECAEFCRDLMERHESLLIICNTKGEARVLFEKLKEGAEPEEWDIYHLSTAMCQKHRIDTLDQIQAGLQSLQAGIQEKKNARRILCVSTQLVEAGIDFSFEGVVRVLAGIDNLAQAAGRCNRSGEYGHPGMVYLINLKNENISMLPEIAHAQNSTRKVLALFQNRKDCSLIGEEMSRTFYQHLFAEAEDQTEYPTMIFGEKYHLARLLSNQNGSAGSKKNKAFVLRQPFRTVGQEFKVFEQDTTDILVPYKEGKALIERLGEIAMPQFHIAELQGLLRQAKGYTVAVYEWQRKKLDQEGLLTTILDGRAYVLNEKAYEKTCGLVVKEQAVEDYIL